MPGANAPRAELRVQNSEAGLVAATSSVRVRVQKKPLRISFLDSSDRVISEDDDRRPMQIESSGFRVFKKMPADEHYYGLGDKAVSFDRRGGSFANWNVDAYDWQESTDGVQDPAGEYGRDSAGAGARDGLESEVGTAGVLARGGHIG